MIGSRSMRTEGEGVFSWIYNRFGANPGWLSTCPLFHSRKHFRSRIGGHLKRLCPEIHLA
jgi:hypothetical protein